MTCLQAVDLADFLFNEYRASNSLVLTRGKKKRAAPPRLRFLSGHCPAQSASECTTSPRYTPHILSAQDDLARRHTPIVNGGTQAPGAMKTREDKGATAPTPKIDDVVCTYNRTVSGQSIPQSDCPQFY